MLITETLIAAVVSAILPAGSWWLLLPPMIVAFTVTLVLLPKGPLHRNARGTSILGRAFSALMMGAYLASTVWVSYRGPETTIIYPVAFLSASLIILCWHSVRALRSPAEVIFGPAFLILGTAFLTNPHAVFAQSSSSDSFSPILTAESATLLSIGLRVQGLSYVLIAALIMLLGLRYLLIRRPRLLGASFFVAALGVILNNLAYAMNEPWMGIFGAVFMGLLTLPVTLLLLIAPHHPTVQLMRLAATTFLTHRSSEWTVVYKIVSTSLVILGIAMLIMSFKAYEGWPPLYLVAAILFGAAMTLTGIITLLSQNDVRVRLRAWWETIIAPQQEP